MQRAILLLFLSFLFSVNAYNQSRSNEQILEELFLDEIEIYFSFEAEQAQINEISRIISIDNVTAGNKVFAYANRKGFSQFLELGLPYTKLIHPGKSGPKPKMLDQVNIRDIEEWDFYPTYEAYISMMEQFENDYPAFCEVFSFGQSFQGRELMMAKISKNVSTAENEPQFLYTSSIHGDELTGYVLMLRLIDYLLSNYGTNTQVTYLLDNVEIWINPLANPDGTYRSGNNTVWGAIRGNYFGVDMNRNYPDPEDGPHPDGNAWQTETQHFMQLAEDEHFVAAANFHGGVEVLNYPWDTWSQLAADNDWWVYLCEEYVETVHEYSIPGYMTFQNNGITNGYQWYSISGGRQDYMNYFHQCREVTAEISDVKLIPENQLDAHWNYNYRSLLTFMEQSTYGIRGTVRDSLTNFPIVAEVNVVFHEADSSMVFSSLPLGNYHRLVYEGTYSVRYSAPGYISKTITNIEVQNYQATTVNVKLMPENGVGGINNHEVSSGIKLMPNPVTGGNVKITSKYTMITAELLSSSGIPVYDAKIYDKQLELSASDFKPGLYFLKIRTEKGYGIKKLIIME